jgi:hypothetical protein
MSYSEADKIRFVAWLQKKYGSLDTLNKAWATQRWSRTLTAWDQVEIPYGDGPGPFERYLDLRRYWSDATVNVLMILENARRRNAPDKPVISNLWDSSDRKGFDYLSTYKQYVSHGSHGYYNGDAISGAFETLMMRGALSEKVENVHQTYYLPSMTPICSLIFEERSNEKPAESDADYMARVNHELAGIEKLEGSYPFTISLSVKAFRLNNFLHELINPEHRKAFLSDPETAFTKASLTDEEKELVRSRNWRGMIHYGVIFFMLEKLGAVLGTTNLHIYSAMKGLSLEDFQKTRNAQVLYSVAGKDEGKTNWDKPAK